MGKRAKEANMVGRIKNGNLREQRYKEECGFESGLVLEYWETAVIVPLYKGKWRGLNARTRASIVGKLCNGARGQSSQ